MEVGDIYTDWTVQDTTLVPKGKEKTILCKCKCGTTKYVNVRNLKNGKSVRCVSCSLRNRNKSSVDAMVGNTYGSWTVLKADTANSKNIICECDCGAVASVPKSNVKVGKSTQCRACGATKHGMSETPFYTSWESMRTRSTKGSPNYRVDIVNMEHDKSWEDFKMFMLDMLPSWFEHGELHRVDNTKGYSKDNCVWLTKSEHSKIHNKEK